MIDSHKKSRIDVTIEGLAIKNNFYICCTDSTPTICCSLLKAFIFLNARIALLLCCVLAAMERRGERQVHGGNSTTPSLQCRKTVCHDTELFVSLINTKNYILDSVFQVGMIKLENCKGLLVR